MGEPRPIQRTAGIIRLNGDGSNIAEYLHHILQLYPDTFDDIIETLQFVLPYMRDLKPVLTDILGHQMHLEMTEKDFKVMAGYYQQVLYVRLHCSRFSVTPSHRR